MTLSLVRTLLELRCEDVLWRCVFRHLLPFVPLRPPNRQRRRFDLNPTVEAVRQFLGSIPHSTRHVEEVDSIP